MECYSIYDFQVVKCAEALFEYNQCAAQNVRTINPLAKMSLLTSHLCAL